MSDQKTERIFLHKTETKRWDFQVFDECGNFVRRIGRGTYSRREAETMLAQLRAAGETVDDTYFRS